MILGTYHFDNPGADYVKSNLDDHLSEKRQKQILEVVELIAQFKPTKVALEDVDGARQQQNYEAYLRGEYTLKATETHQLGFRLAKQFNHQRVYAIDHQLEMNLESVIAAAQQNSDRSFLGMFQKDYRGGAGIRQAKIDDDRPRHFSRIQ